MSYGTFLKSSIFENFGELQINNFSIIMVRQFPFQIFIDHLQLKIIEFLPFTLRYFLILLFQSSSMEMKKIIQDWNAWADEHHQQICFYGDKVLDLSKCLKLQLLQFTNIREFTRKDITECLKQESYARRKKIDKIANICIIGSIIPSENSTVQMSSTLIKDIKSKKKVCFVKSTKIDESKRKLTNLIGTNTSITSIKQSKQNNWTSFSNIGLKENRSVLKKKLMSLSNIENQTPQSRKDLSSKNLETKQEVLEYTADSLEFEEEIKARKIPILRVCIKRND